MNDDNFTSYFSFIGPKQFLDIKSIKNPFASSHFNNWTPSGIKKRSKIIVVRMLINVDTFIRFGIMLWYSWPTWYWQKTYARDVGILYVLLLQQSTRKRLIRLLPQIKHGLLLLMFYCPFGFKHRVPIVAFCSNVNSLLRPVDNYV